MNLRGGEIFPGVSRDDNDDPSATAIADSGYINFNLSKVAELHRRNILDHRRHRGFITLE